MSLDVYKRDSLMASERRVTLLGHTIDSTTCGGADANSQ